MHIYRTLCLRYTDVFAVVIDILLLCFRFAPDWVLRKDKLKDIVDPLRAIQMVAETLSIVL